MAVVVRVEHISKVDGQSAPTRKVLVEGCGMKMIRVKIEASKSVVWFWLWMSIRRIKLFVLVGRQGTSKLRIGCVAKLVQTNPQFILCLVWCYWHQSIWLLAPVDDSVDHRFQTRGLWVAFIQPLANILISSHLTQIFFWCASVFLETWQIFKLDVIKGIEIWNHFEFITFWNASQIRSLDDLTLGSTLFSSASFFMAAPQAASHRLVLGPTSLS